VDDVDESLRAVSFARRSRATRLRAIVLALVGVAALGAAGVALTRLREVPAHDTAGAPSAAPAAADTGAVTMSALAQQNVGLADAVAEVRPIVRTVRATGIVGPDETRIVRMRPLSRGRLMRTEVELGSRVRAGQVLASYDNIEIGDLAGQLAIAQAGLAQARAEADTAHKAVERARELLAANATARADLERRQADDARAVAALRTQEAEIAKLNEKLRRFGVAAGRASTASPIQAPIDGVVIKIDVVPGEIVDVEREIFTIADLGTVWVQADILEKDLAAVRPGLDATVAVAAYPERRFAARVSYVADMLDPKTNTARVRCTLANPDGALKLNMFAGIDIAVPAGRVAVTVPPAALQAIDDKPVVFVRTGRETFERRDVRLGLEQRAWIEIADGVAAGETMVTTGSFQLKSILLRDRLAND
jgi:cobalt-zinc-cadmium efflux system membrane fusion protein